MSYLSKRERRIFFCTFLCTLLVLLLLGQMTVLNQLFQTTTDFLLDKEDSIHIKPLEIYKSNINSTNHINMELDIPLQKSNDIHIDNHHVVDIYSQLVSVKNQCPISIKEKYALESEANSVDSSSDLQWCQSSRDSYNVQIGRSWGNLPSNFRKKWDEIGCNDLLKLGKLQTCDERFGWKYFTDWLENIKLFVAGKSENLSQINCATSLKTNVYCQSLNVVIDFSKATTSGKVRNFASGFFQVYGEKMQNNILEVEGLEYISIPDEKQRLFTMEDMHCDIVEERPTYILSNDDIYNLGHYINDVIGIWAMVVMSNRQVSDAVLLNIDGIREGGPAGGPNHRLMEELDPDRHGPYVSYFKSWFYELKRGKDYTNKRVCFKELYLPPTPGIPWFWNDWGIINKCSQSAASPLYQSFNVFLRSKWIETFGKDSLQSQSHEDKVHIIIEVRKINPKKINNHSTARYIRNLSDLVLELEKIPNVEITTQDFAELSFEEQVKLSHSAGIFISMHGAGTTHIFHQAIGTPNCCALVELFPDQTIEFYTAQGYGNLARMLGFHHYRYVAELGATSRQGTAVNIEEIKQLVTKAVEDVRLRPTCLHDVKDTAVPIYSKSYFEL